MVRVSVEYHHLNLQNVFVTKIYLALLSFNNSRMTKVRCILNDDIYIHDAGYVKM